MKKVGYVYDPVCLKHEAGAQVENRGRVEGIMALLEETGLKERLTAIPSRSATPEEILLVHAKEYVDQIERGAEKGGKWVDHVTTVSPGSYEAALYSAGSALSAVESVMTGNVDHAFSLMRPPGHHATAMKAIGFCFFNNVAIAARCALKRHRLLRVAIVDFDVHHGNGTSEVFYDDPEVLYISTHQYPLYPWGGSPDEMGSGKGIGANINIPLPVGCGDDEYRKVFERIIVPAIRRFRPELILVSAGYDPHWADKMSLMQVSITGFAGMVEGLRATADEVCNGRLFLCLEGGYDLKALAYSVKASFDVLLGNPNIEDPLGLCTGGLASPRIDSWLDVIREKHRL